MCVYVSFEYNLHYIDINCRLRLLINLPIGVYLDNIVFIVKTIGTYRSQDRFCVDISGHGKIIVYKPMSLTINLNIDYNLRVFESFFFLF